MAMNWLQQMFTPQRPGPGQMAWRDKDVGEGSGEISQGDIQEMYWKRDPAKTRNRGQMMTSAVQPNPQGMGVNPMAQIARDMEDELGIGGGGAGSALPISADVSVSESGPSGSIGASIAESMSPSTMTPGSSRWSGVSMNDNWIQNPYQARNAFQAPTPNLGDVEGMDIPATDITSSDPLYRDRIRRAGGNVTFPDKNPNPSVPPGIAQLMKLLGGMGSGISSLFTPGKAGAGAPGPTTPSLMGPPTPPIMPGLSSTGSDSLARHYFRS